jgi:hypothetical protein
LVLTSEDSCIVAYLVLIAPLSVVRFLGFRNHPVNFQITISSGLIFSLSGFVDVLLFIWAKPAFGVERGVNNDRMMPPYEIEEFSLVSDFACSLLVISEIAYHLVIIGYTVLKV